MMTKEELVSKAFEAMENAYAPYSNYKVGAAVLLKDGNVVKGCNIENASYGATNCGERTAVFAAYAQGYRKDDIIALAIVTSGHQFGAPCGICRQVLSELMNMETPIYLGYEDKIMETNIKELLPMSFSSEDLK